MKIFLRYEKNESTRDRNWSTNDQRGEREFINNPREQEVGERLVRVLGEIINDRELFVIF